MTEIMHGQRYAPKKTSKLARANSAGGQFLFLFFHLQFLKIYAYMHLFCFMVAVYFLYYVPFTGSTNLLLQLARYNLLLYVHHPLWSSSLSQSLTRIHFFLLIVFSNNAIKLYFSMAMPMVFQLLTCFLDRTLTIYLVGPHLLLKLLQFDINGETIFFSWWPMLIARVASFLFIFLNFLS